ncbi:efflux transporter outer membrane subunit [Phenylobacterium aquaticum]|uniref:efflux transporter outer membrane subunit n=1 Tax=Phenylobacterium aquaticum TaxID=1763816 RepID=UPI0026EB8DE5|nr:efflux transporter outer membrane subunit [Phenylobacterium aquaticum]
MSPTSPSPRRVPSCLAILACLAAAGCAVGPDFKRPAPPVVNSYAAETPATTVATPDVAGGAAQSLRSTTDISGDWWTLFHSPALTALVDRSLKANPDLKAAQAALAVARENTLAQRGAFLPGVSAGLTGARSRTSDPAPTSTPNVVRSRLFTPQVSIAYAPDVFGLNRRTHESLQAQEQAARDQMLAAYLTLTANVANAAIQDASLRAQIDATHELIALNTKALEAVSYQANKGYASPLDVAAQRAQLAQTAATLPPLLTQLAQQHDLLAALTGRFPSQAPPEDLDLASLTLPQDLPLSLPSDLVAQRPDVLQAEANLHAASAQIGIAVANRLPSLQITGDAGATALAFSHAFGPGGGFWDLSAAVTAPVFQGGSLLHQERAARAGYVQASEQYRSTVLTAFQNVADTLAALEHDAEGLKAAAASAEAAKLTLDLSERQWRAGYASYLALLSAEQGYQQARIGLIQAQAARYADTTALYQALGGGWWRRAEFSGNQDGH